MWKYYSIFKGMKTNQPICPVIRYKGNRLKAESGAGPGLLWANPDHMVMIFLKPGLAM